MICLRVISYYIKQDILNLGWPSWLGPFVGLVESCHVGQVRNCGGFFKVWVYTWPKISYCTQYIKYEVYKGEMLHGKRQNCR